MGIAKDFRFPVEIGQAAGPRVRATAPGRPPLSIATPAEFRGGVEGTWSPEDLLVAAVASCFELTFKSIAARRGLVYERLDVTGTGHVTLLADNQIGFLAIELDVVVEAAPGAAHAAETAARRAHDHCIVGRALAVPVELSLEVRTPELAHA
jgi:organic hydroperoxide reductase OsmC/OhrA